VADSELMMTEAGVTALMCADDEASWKQAGLFNEVPRFIVLSNELQTTSARAPYLSRRVLGRQESLLQAQRDHSGARVLGGSRQNSSGQKRRGPVSGEERKFLRQTNLPV
jgi:hypothetical protein